MIPDRIKSINHHIFYPFTKIIIGVPYSLFIYLIRFYLCLNYIRKRLIEQKLQRIEVKQYLGFEESI